MTWLRCTNDIAKMHQWHCWDAPMTLLKCTNDIVEMHQWHRWDAPMSLLRCTNDIVEMHQWHRWDAPMTLLGCTNDIVEMHQWHCWDALNTCDMCIRWLLRCTMAVVGTPTPSLATYRLLVGVWGLELWAGFGDFRPNYVPRTLTWGRT